MMTIPTAQEKILAAKTQKQEAAVLAEISRTMAGICSDNPKVYYKLVEIEQRGKAEN